MLDGMIAGVNGPEERDGRLTAAGPAPVRRPLDGSFSRTGPAACPASTLAQRGSLLLEVIRPAVGQGGAPAGERDGPGHASPGPGFAEREHPRRELLRPQVNYNQPAAPYIPDLRRIACIHEMAAGTRQ
jgi:hypothetical protein